MRSSAKAHVAMAALLLSLGGGSGAAWAHGTVAHTSAAEERALELSEERALGVEHAHEHAMLRRLARAAAASRRRHQAWLRSLPPARRKRVVAREARAARARVARERARARAAAGPARAVGRWTSGPARIPVMGINAAVLPTGKVLFWAYPTNPNPVYNPDYRAGGIEAAPNNSSSAVWDPRTRKSRIIAPPVNPDTGQRTNLWCSGISFLPDGRVLAVGGNLGYTPDWRGLQRAYVFDPWKETWTEVGSMRHGRWYPTQRLLPDGRTLVMQGYDETGTQTYNRDIEIFDPASGQMILIGELGAPGAPPVGGYYPHLFVLPSGRVLVAGPDRFDSWLFDRPGLDLAWTDIADLARDRQWGTAVQLPGGPGGSTQVMLLGGSWPGPGRSPDAVNSTEIFDEANPAAGWQPAANLNVGRSHANTVLLPDGSMVEIGGGLGTTTTPSQAPAQYAVTDADKQIELWDPATRAWRLGPAQSEYRAYHSTAALLPDGRVISAGDDYDGPGGPGTGLSQDTVEIYSPPYLFKGPRPRITQAPNTLNWNTSFSIASPNPNITHAVLIAPAATTHANDTNQRALQLPLQKRPDDLGYTLTTPTTPNAAPPGYYMLFLLNNHNIPSPAHWIKLDPNAPPPLFDAERPRVLFAKLRPRRVRTHGSRRGATFRLRLSERARVSIRFQRARPGRKSGRRCAKATRANRRRAACTRYVNWGPKLRTGIRAGNAKIRFTGTLGRRALPSGHWRATVIARDPAGNHSPPRHLTFRVVRS